MMYCINAVLLIQHVLPNFATHMIFTGIDRRFPGKSSQISVYKSSMEGFPKPEDNSGIFMAIDSSKSVGYHHAIYCSGNMPYQLMMSKIMGTARPMSKQEIFQSHKRVGNYESCFKYLQLRNTENKQNGVKDEIKMSNVIGSRSCTPAAIATLAYERKVSLTGVNNCFAPKFEESSTPIPIKVNADIAVKVEDLVLPRHSIIFTSGIIVRALVWYQGEMQVIQQCDKNKPAWFLLTNLSESNDHLAWALRRYNEIVGKNVMLLKKSELPMKLNPKKLSNNNSNSEDPHYKIKQLVKGSRSTKRVSGVLVEKSECFKYHSKSLGSRLKNRLSPSKDVDYD